MLAATFMLVTRCIRVEEARSSVDWQVLLVIGASIGLGTALDKTGAACTACQCFSRFNKRHAVADSCHAIRSNCGFVRNDFECRRSGYYVPDCGGHEQ